jgi:hypothetical protein
MCISKQTHELLVHTANEIRDELISDSDSGEEDALPHSQVQSPTSASPALRKSDFISYD